MSDDISPALSASDWAYLAKHGDCNMESQVGANSWWDGNDGYAPFIALANASLLDDSPYKITFNDWSDLVSAVSNMERLAALLEDRPDLAGSVYPVAVRRRATTIKRMAAKIKAILPPMTE